MRSPIVILAVGCACIFGAAVQRTVDLNSLPGPERTDDAQPFCFGGEPDTCGRGDVIGIIFNDGAAEIRCEDGHFVVKDLNFKRTGDARLYVTDDGMCAASQLAYSP